MVAVQIFDLYGDIIKKSSKLIFNNGYDEEKEVEIESKIIDIDSETVAKYFINVLEVAKFVTIKPSNDGKIVMTSEFDISRD